MNKLHLGLWFTLFYLISCANDAQQRTRVSPIKAVSTLSGDAQAANNSEPKPSVDPATGAQPENQQATSNPNGTSSNANTMMSQGTAMPKAPESSPAPAAQNNPAAPVKLTCPQMPTITSPVNPDGPTCAEHCREKLKIAVAYVNALVTKPNVYVPGDDHLKDKVIAGNIFNAINAAGNDAGRVYATPCNPLAGVDYRKK